MSPSTFVRRSALVALATVAVAQAQTAGPDEPAAVPSRLHGVATIQIGDLATTWFDRRPGVPIGFGPLVEPTAFLSLAWSHDARLLAAGSGSGQVYVWDTERRAVVFRFREGGGRVHSLSFSHDGRWLAAGKDSNVAVVWDLEDGQRAWRGHGSRVAFAPDRATLLHGAGQPDEAAGSPLSLTRFDRDAPHSIGILPTRAADGLRTASWHASSGWLALLLADHGLMLRLPDGSLRDVDDGGRFLEAIVWAGEDLMALSMTGRLYRLHRAREAGRHWQLLGTTTGAGSLAWLGSEQLLAIGSTAHDEGVTLLDPQLDVVLTTLLPSRRGVAAVEWGGGELAVAGLDRRLTLWRPSSSELSPLTVAEPFGSLVATSDHFVATVLPMLGAIEIWPLGQSPSPPIRVPLRCPDDGLLNVDRVGRQAPRLEAAGWHTTRVTHLASSTDGRFLAISMSDGQKRILDLESNRSEVDAGPCCLSIITDSQGPVAISDDGTLLLEAGPGAVSIWLDGNPAGSLQPSGDRDRGASSAAASSPTLPKALALTGDGDLAALVAPNTLTVWDGVRSQSRVISSVDLPRPIRDLVFEDRDHVIALHDDGGLARYALQTNRWEPIGSTRFAAESSRLWRQGVVVVRDRALSLHDLDGQRIGLRSSSDAGWSDCRAEGCWGTAADGLFGDGTEVAESQRTGASPTDGAAASAPVVPTREIRCWDRGGSHVLLSGVEDPDQWAAGRQTPEATWSRVTPVSLRETTAPPTPSSGTSRILLRQLTPPFRHDQLDCVRYDP